MPNRRQAIISTNDGLIWWCIYASLGFNELINKTSWREHEVSPYLNAWINTLWAQITLLFEQSNICYVAIVCWTEGANKWVHIPITCFRKPSPFLKDLVKDIIWCATRGHFERYVPSISIQSWTIYNANADNEMMKTLYKPTWHDYHLQPSHSISSLPSLAEYVVLVESCGWSAQIMLFIVDQFCLNFFRVLQNFLLISP